MKSLTGNPTVLLEEALGEIQEHAYIQIPLSLDHSKLQEAAESFLSFLSLPLEIKRSFNLQSNLGEKFTTLGYMRRTKENSVDNKELFHYNTCLQKAYINNPNNNLPEVKKFLALVEEIDQAAAKTLRDILGILTTRYPKILTEYPPDKISERTVLRFLKYDVEGAGNFLAHGHYDAGGCTLALGESAPGLRLGKTEKDLKQTQHQEKTALFMPALYFKDITDDLFHPVWHDVVQLSQDTFSSTIARWSIVFFANGVSQNSRPTDKEIYHSR